MHIKHLAFYSIILFAYPLAQATQPSKIAGAVQPLVDRHELAGAIMLVASKDTVLDLETVGYTDIAAKKAMPADALFWVASMTKPITATAVLMLVDQGKLRLDDPVEKYLPEFKPKLIITDSLETRVWLASPQHKVTVRQLLSHQSGLSPFSAIGTKLDYLPLTVRVQSYVLQPLVYEPGTDTQYSNAGFDTVGRIVEVVSGMRFEDFLQQRIFNPLGMKNTTFWPSAAQLERLAKSYKPNDATGIEETPIAPLSYPLTDREHRRPSPAGGLFSTAADLLRFCEMYLNGGKFGGKRYLSEQAIAGMTRDLGHNAILNYEGYGLGWGTRGSGVYGHTSAYASSMTIDPTRGLIMIWMVQHAGEVGYAGQMAFEAAATRVYAEQDRQSKKTSR